MSDFAPGFILQVAELLGMGPPVKIVGDDHLWHVPWRDDNHPSLALSNSKNTWNDRARSGPDDGGGIMDLVRIYEKISADEAKTWMREHKIIGQGANGDRDLLQIFADARGLKYETLVAFKCQGTMYWNNPAVKIPERDAQGREISTCWRQAYNKRLTWTDKKTGEVKSAKSMSKAKRPRGIFYSSPLADGDGIIVEGFPDAARVWDTVGPVAVIGVPSASLGDVAIATVTELMRGRRVTIIPDRGNGEEAFIRSISDALAGSAAEVKVAQIPPESGAKDIDEFLSPLAPSERRAALLTVLGNAQSFTPALDEDDTETTKKDDPEPQAAGLPAGLMLTEAGNAQLLAERIQGRFLYEYEPKAWRVWTGTHWCNLRADIALEEEARTIPTCWFHAGMRTDDSDKRDALFRWAKKSASKNGLTNTIALARSVRGSNLVVSSAEFDRDPDVINTISGVLNLRTGKFTKHHPSQRHTRIIKTEYNPGAKCPLWEKFLWQIFKGDTQLIKYMQRAMGYFLTGRVSEQIILIFYGDGANGKGVFVNAIQHVFGPYATQLQAEIFLEDARPRGAGDASPHLFDLKGVRAAFASEAKRGGRLAEAQLKHLSGGDRVKARALYSKPVEFEPSWKLAISTNFKPRASQDKAVWRRLRLIPFDVSFEGREDKRLGEKLRAEAEGILAWTVEGSRQWYAQGLQEPESVRAATATYRKEEDVIGRFLDERTIHEVGASVNATALFEAYQKWCEENRERPLSGTAFGRELNNLNLRKEKKRQCNVYHDIRIRRPNEPFGPSYDPNYPQQCEPQTADSIEPRMVVEGSDSFSRINSTFAPCEADFLENYPNPAKCPQDPEIDPYDAEERAAIQAESGA